VSNRPGFVSGTAVLLAAVTLVALLGWVSIGGPALLSPGALNAQARARTLGGVTSHAQLAGDCGACHTAPWSSRTMADRCVACHKEIGTELQSRSGLHGTLAWRTSSPTCRGCHPEHNGPNGSLNADAARFPHDLTRYSLRGHRRTAKGAKVTCAGCHPKGLASFDQGTCADCHATLDTAFMSRHEASFGKECLPCHDGTDRFGAGFEHNKLPFRLTGKHTGLACERCHAAAGSIQALKAAPQACGVCHAKSDKHKGAFGQQCGQCHTTDSWANAKFDHTIFPVNHGSDAQTATCQTCHPTDVSTYTCYGCHAHTPASILSQHEGRAISGLADCIRCHAGGRKGD
jgi:hypothetical protein